MTRRQKTGLFEDLIDVVSRLPWWACLGLAALSYLVLHALATPMAVTSVQPGQIGALATQALWKGWAYAGQIVVPMAFVFGAVLSALRRAKRGRLVSEVAQSRAPDALHAMSWRDFEMLVGEAFRLQGYEVAETGGGGADGGVDLVLRRDGEKFLVQCKQWRARKVRVQLVRELYGVMAAQGAVGGFVVTAGEFTEEASAFASGRNVKLVDGKALFGLIQQARASFAAREDVGRPVRRPPAPAPVRRREPAAGQAEAVPTCPSCSRAMTLKTARRGPNAGNQFWSCMGYPACTGTRPTA
ncbi:restriction endonuclease [Piscinibacter koreensis]|uniref:Restriction endonuclease n=1 Tax=Piscinibacter koreensis TaxID=2742824 RepID=A0A7Y6TZD6_9BURK|nr:restriction endonuclease [Schlegelella koreensis]NUZ09006.1 restriction endonuclease [Schlegelella koreensis]